MPLSFICFAALAKTPALRILMLGNSHTAANGLSQTLESLLNSDGGGPASVTVRTAAFLNDFANPSIERELRRGRWDFVVLQGAMLSGSHRYRYSQAGGIQVAKWAREGGAQVLWFAEWSRDGWKETGYTLGIYDEMAREAGGKIVPINRTWDAYLEQNPKAPLWQGDGNHARPLGSLLAGQTLYLWIRGSDVGKPAFRPRDVSTAEAEAGWAAARATFRARKH